MHRSTTRTARTAHRVLRGTSTTLDTWVPAGRRLVLVGIFGRRDPIGAVEPAAQIDIGTALGTKRLEWRDIADDAITDRTLSLTNRTHGQGTLLMRAM